LDIAKLAIIFSAPLIILKLYGEHELYGVTKKYEEVF
jgi:hypothetical protein